MRDCARSSNNREHTRIHLSATDVKGKKYFERSYLVLGLSPFEPRELSLCTHNPTACSTAISRFLCKFFPKLPLIFCLRTIHQVIFHFPITLSGGGYFSCERTQILSGIQFKGYFIECIVVETKHFVSTVAPT